MATHFSLRDFILAGVLGGARAGMTRGEVHSVFGDPDAWAGEPSDKAGIWRFGLDEGTLSAISAVAPATSDGCSLPVRLPGRVAGAASRHRRARGCG